MVRVALILVMIPMGAVAAPPPPPLPNVAPVAQRYLRALKVQDLTNYRELLTPTFVGDDPERPNVRARAAWLEATAGEFANPRYQVSAERVFYAGSAVEGSYTQRIMIVEQVSDFSFGQAGSRDCCSWHRVETLTLDGDKIARIERTTLYETELSPTGFRKDIPEVEQQHY